MANPCKHRTRLQEGIGKAALSEMCLQRLNVFPRWGPPAEEPQQPSAPPGAHGAGTGFSWARPCGPSL